MRIFSRIIIFFLVMLLVVGTIFSAAPAATAQDAATPAATTPAATSATTGDDSDELPILVNVSGKVENISATVIRIGTTDIIIPAGTTLPGTISVGTVVTIRANLRNDDTFSLITIVIGQPTVTPTALGTMSATDQPTASSTEMVTEQPTDQPTLSATLEGTAGPTTTPIPGCDKSNQRIAFFVSSAFDVAYRNIVALHCRGYSYGVIARAYLIVISGKEQGKTLDVVMILLLRGKGNRWLAIIVFVGVNVDSNALIIVIVGNGSRVNILWDCGKFKKIKWCVVSTGGGGKGKGGMGDMGDDD